MSLSDRAQVSWRALLWGFALPMALFAGGLTAGWIKLSQEDDRIRMVRLENVKRIESVLFENCVRNNFQDVRDRSQDELLLGLINAVLSPGSDVEQRRAFREAQTVLLDRVANPVPPFDREFIEQFSRRPRDCAALATSDLR